MITIDLRGRALHRLLEGLVSVKDNERKSIRFKISNILFLKKYAEYFLNKVYSKNVNNFFVSLKFRHHGEKGRNIQNYPV